MKMVLDILRKAIVILKKEPLFIMAYKASPKAFLFEINSWIIFKQNTVF